MSHKKAIELQDKLETLLGKRGFVKTMTSGGHYVQVYVGELTLDFFLEDDLSLKQRKESNKVCQFNYKGMTTGKGFGSAMSDWSKSTISQALIEGLKIVTKPKR